MQRLMIIAPVGDCSVGPAASTRGWETRIARGLDSGCWLVERWRPDVIVLSGLVEGECEAIRSLIGIAPHVGVLIGVGAGRDAVACVRAGANIVLGPSSYADFLRDEEGRALVLGAVRIAGTDRASGASSVLAPAG